MSFTPRPRPMTRRRRRTGRIFIPGVIAIVGTLMVLNVLWEFTGPGSRAARHLAIKDAGLTSVISTHYAVFSWCHSDLVGFHVTGLRNGQRVTVTSCVQPLGLFDYVRNPAL